ncbi:MAG: class I SAM-dependent methyltransferase [Patescibacteria group bacterium]
MSVDYYKNTVNIFAHTSVPWQQDVLFDFLKKIKAAKNSKILDAGSGIGNNIKTLLKFSSDITAADISKGALNISKEKINGTAVNYALADLHKLFFADNYFDVVICTEVLEHCANPMQVMSELKRITKNGGSIVISAPNYFNLAGLYKKIFEIIFRKNWDAWGTHEGGVENFMSFHKLRNYFAKLDLKIVEERGGDLIRSWTPFFKKYYQFIDKHPFLQINKKWPFKFMAMNYFCILRK